MVNQACGRRPASGTPFARKIHLYPAAAMVTWNNGSVNGGVNGTWPNPLWRAPGSQERVPRLEDPGYLDWGPQQLIN
jgi:hypothetical protein